MSDIHALSGAYAVDALDDLERAKFERHLAECDDCASEVASLREASALLAETTLVEPSAQLRENVLAGIAQIRPLPPVVENPAETEATVTALEPRRRRRVVTFLAAAAAVVAVGAGGTVALQQLNDGPQDRFSAIADASDARSFPQDLGGGVKATVVVSKKRNEAYIQTENMPAAPAGKQYVLWLQHGATMTQAGVMPEGPDNKVVLSGDAATADGAAVSVEDAGSEPTSPSDDIAVSFTFA